MSREFCRRRLLDTTSFRRELNYREELLNPELMLIGLRSPSFFNSSASRILSIRKELRREKSNKKKDYSLSPLRAVINQKFNCLDRYGFSRDDRKFISEIT